ncbi:MAG: hypothetical protein ABSH53_00385 [Holophaga sp.]
MPSTVRHGTQPFLSRLVSGQYFSIKYFTLLIVFIILAFTTSSFTGDLNYVFYGLLLLVLAGRYVLLGRLPRLRLQKHDLLPLFLLLLWLYGFILGFLNHNPPEGVFRNFAGMILFSLYYIYIILDIPKDWVFTTLLLASWVNLVTAFAGVAAGVSKLGLSFFLSNVATERLFYFGGVILVFILISVMLTTLLVPRKAWPAEFLDQSWLIPRTRMTRMLVFALASLPVLASFSKGYLLAFLFLLVALPLALTGRTLVRRKLSPGLLAAVLLVGSVAGLGGAVGLSTLAANTFSTEDVSNVTRYEQTAELVQDLTPLGKGLGATLPGGYSRDELGYGFEVSYVNIFHKFGIFALLLLYAYAWILFRILGNLYRRAALAYSSLALGAMCYLFPSIGNPILLGSIPNILFASVLYLLRDEPPSALGGKGPVAPLPSRRGSGRSGILLNETLLQPGPIDIEPCPDRHEQEGHDHPGEPGGSAFRDGEVGGVENVQ